MPLTVVASLERLVSPFDDGNFRFIVDSFLDLFMGEVRLIDDVELPPFGNGLKYVDCDGKELLDRYHDYSFYGLGAIR